MAGKKKGCFIFFVVLIGGGFVVAHFWAVGKIEEGIRTAILEGTEFPPVLKGFSALLPVGRFSADYLETKARIDDNLLEVKSTNIALNLDPGRYFKDLYEIRNLKAESIQATYLVPEENLKLDGRFEVEAHSSKQGPLDNPPGSLWAEEVQVRLDTLTATLENLEWELLWNSTLRLVPMNFVPEVGLSGKTDFDFYGHLTPSEELNLIMAKGRFESEEDNLRIEASVSSLQFPSRMKWLEHWLREEGVSADEFITSGSLSYRIAGNLEGDLFKGEMTLRVLRPEFGDALREMAEDYPIEPLLNLLENESEPIEIGPIEFEENITTPQVESLPSLIGGLTREFFELSSNRGSGNLMDMFRAKRPNDSSGN